MWSANRAAVIAAALLVSGALTGTVFAKNLSTPSQQGNNNTALQKAVNSEKYTDDQPDVRIITGIVNNDGTRLTTLRRQWAVSDPWMLNGHYRQQIEAKAEVQGRESTSILDVVKGYPTYWADWRALHYGDSAYVK